MKWLVPVLTNTAKHPNGVISKALINTDHIAALIANPEDPDQCVLMLNGNPAMIYLHVPFETLVAELGDDVKVFAESQGSAHTHDGTTHTH